MIIKINHIGNLINADYPGIQSDWLDKLREIIGKINVGIDNVNDLQSQVTTTDGNLSELTEQVEQLRSDLDNLTTTVGDHTTAIGMLQQEMVAVKGDIATLQSSVDGIKADITAINVQIATINNSIAAINATLEDHTNHLATLDGNVTDLQQKDEELQSSIETNQHNIEKLQEITTNQGQDIAGLRRDVDTHTQQITDQLGAINDLTARVDDHQTAITDAQAAIGNLTTQVTANVQHLLDHNKQIAQLQEDVIMLTKDLTNLEARFQTLSQTVGVQANTIAAMQITIGHMQDDISQLGDRMTAAEGRIDTINTTITAINNTLASMQGDIKTLQDAMTAAQSNIDQLNTITANHDTQITALQQDKVDKTMFANGQDGQVWTAGDGTSNPASGYWHTPDILPEVAERLDSLDTDVSGLKTSVSEIPETYVSRETFSGGTAGDVWTAGDGSEGKPTTGYWGPVGETPEVDQRLIALEAKTETQGNELAAHETIIQNIPSTYVAKQTFENGTDGQVWTAGQDGAMGWEAIPADPDVATNTAAIASMQDHVNTLQTTVDSNTAELATHATNITDLQNDVNGNISDISSLQSDKLDKSTFDATGTANGMTWITNSQYPGGHWGLYSPYNLNVEGIATAGSLLYCSQAPHRWTPTAGIQKLNSQRVMVRDTAPINLVDLGIMYDDFLNHMTLLYKEGQRVKWGGATVISNTTHTAVALCYIRLDATVEGPPVATLEYILPIYGNILTASLNYFHVSGPVN